MVMGQNGMAKQMMAYSMETAQEIPRGPTMIPTGELQELADGGEMNIYDPAFRRRSPELGALIDRQMKADGRLPIDIELVGGLGV